jgi:hypothetical protein
MTRFRFDRRVTWALGAVLASTSTAWACSYVAARTASAWLGVSMFDDVSAPLPSNLAQCDALTPSELDFDVFGRRCRPIEPGTEVRTYAATLQVSTEPDETAPTVPVMTDAVYVPRREHGGDGCGGSSCGPSATPAHLSLVMELTDDRAPSTALTFAVWVSDAPEPVPSRAPSWVGMQGAFGGFASDRRISGPVGLTVPWSQPTAGRDRWVTVAVADQAGNITDFSEPMWVDTGERGCATGGLPQGMLLPALLGLWASSRARRRRPRGGR